MNVPSQQDAQIVDCLMELLSGVPYPAALPCFGRRADNRDRGTGGCTQDEQSPFYNLNVVVMSPVEQSVSLRATLDLPYYRKSVLMLKGSSLVRPC